MRIRPGITQAARSLVPLSHPAQRKHRGENSIRRGGFSSASRLAPTWSRWFAAWLPLVMVVSGLAATAWAEPSARPNVLLIAVDDLRPELGCYGKPGMQTPNIDGLASQGVVFDRHYVQFAVCIPSRVALLTSLRSERTHQVYGPPVWQKVKGAQPLGKTFRSAGYATVSLGKIWHVEGGEIGDEFDVRWMPNGGDYADPDSERIKRLRQNRRSQAKREGKRFQEDPNLLPPITESADVPDNTYKDGMIADRALDEMQRLQASDQPFLLAVGFIKPHLPFVAPQKYWELYDEAAMPLAANPEFPEEMPEVAFSGHPNMFSYSYGAYEPFEKGQRMPDRTARHLIHAYRAATSFSDAQVGRVLKELERLGLADNTIVVLWGDHGWHLGDSGLWSKHTNYEVATHSPLIVRAPGRTRANTRCPALVETVDIFPTLLDLCGLSPLPVSDGTSFAPLLRDPQRTWKEAAFHVFNRNRDGLVLGHAVRTERYRLVAWRRGWELDGEAVATELYDYEQDPHETRNVADDPDYGEVRRELEALLRAGPADQVPLGDARGSGHAEYVRVSPRDARYFELTDGQPYIPVGFNLVGAPQAEDLERVVDRMAEHGVNYCRIWLDVPLWGVEQKQSGVYEAEQAEQLDRFLKLCRERGIRVKMCVEWFRSILAEWPDPPRKGWFPKPLHHRANGGFYEDMTDFLTSERGREQFKAKLEWYAGRYGDEPAVFAWELWNEMNAVRGPWLPWTEEMLSELQERFPKNLAVQSLGSFDRDRAREQYRQLCELPDNDVLQVHRYLDLGAQLSVCHGPVDVLAADAVQELRAFQIRKPIILTETGAVRPNHSGPSELYEQDHAGILLHDMLFAPFFAGAAGPGHVWFWRQAIDDPNHWYHFQRFRRALDDIDPPAEAFEPLRVEHPELRIYALRGKTTLLAWCRDRANDWQTEFKQGTPPRRLQGLEVNLASFEPDQKAQDLIVDAYDPWQDRSQPVPCSDGRLRLPEFERSLVLRIRSAEPDAPAD